MNANRLLRFAAILPAAALLTSCAMGPGETTGTAVGAGAGALAGGVIGNNVKGISTTEGAIGGAVVGGLLGNTMGRQNDRIDRVERQQYGY
jgi:outer membrane lipoprotein SlyB